MKNGNYGLLGEKLGHSFSPRTHKMIGELTGSPYTYELYEKAPSEVGAFVKSGDWEGLNVTIPYKQTVMEYCDELSDAARRIGAVNTLVRKDGKIIGYNTDYIGFKRSLELAGVSVSGKKALVLGTGGASKAVCCALEDMGAEVVLVGRTSPVNYQNIHEHDDAELIVNTTPVGMYPKTGASAVFPATFPNLEWAIDVIYNPLRTNFLCQAKRAGLKTLSGLAMLILQAIATSEHFFDTKIDESVYEKIKSELVSEKQNIVLIGMPGVGKTTCGMMLSSELGKEFYDIDKMIVDMTGKEIPEIFEEGGEDGFREIESQVVSDLSSVTGAVIACGGGVVTREENYYKLAENGKLVFLNRDITVLPTDGRPISQSVPLARLYKARLPLYRGWCDMELAIDNLTPEETSETIMH